MNRSSPTHRAAMLESLENRLGARFAAGLSQRADALPHDVTERLRFGREQALLRLSRAAARRPAATWLGIGRDRAATLGSVWLQLASWAPLVALVAGLLLIQQWTVDEQVDAAAEIDAVLLSDDLPPAAYTDAGFREFSRAPRP